MFAVGDKIVYPMVLCRPLNSMSLPVKMSIIWL